MSKFAKGIKSKKMQRTITKKKDKLPGNLIITLYKLTKIEAPSCNGF